MDREIADILNLTRNALAGRGIMVKRFVLFGSCATGDRREYSDVDVVIVSDDFTELDIFQRLELIGIAQARAGITASMDVIPVTEREYEEANRGTFIGDEVKPKGAVIS